MGKINLARVFLGGLVAALVIMTGDVIVAVAVPTVLRTMPSQWVKVTPPTPGSMIIYASTLLLVGGPAAMWFYAAIRPRFGAGPKTAAYAGLWIWLILGPYLQTQLIASGYPNAFSFGLWVGMDAVTLPMIILAMIAGASVYKEESAPATRSAAAGQSI